MFCQHCGTQLLDNAKFCNVCGQAVLSTASPIPEKTRSASSIATAAPAGKKHRKIIPLLLTLILPVVIVATSFCIINAIERNTPLNRVISAIQNTLEENDFTVFMDIADGYNINSKKFSVDYTPDDHFAFDYDTYLVYLDYTNEYSFFLSSSNPKHSEALFGEDYYDNQWENDQEWMWYHYFREYYLINAIGKFILDDRSYLDDIETIITEEKKFSHSNTDIAEVIEHLQELFQNKEFIENACKSRIVEKENIEQVLFSIDRYSDFWPQFITCISPILSSDELEDFYEEFCYGTYGLDINFTIQDDLLYACTLNVTEYNHQGEVKETFSLQTFLTDIGTTQINGLESSKEMQRKANLYRLNPKE